jgi:hypothetical protein
LQTSEKQNILINILMIPFQIYFESYEISSPAEDETHTELLDKFRKILGAADIHLSLAQLAVPLAAFGGSHINDMSGISKVFYTNGRQIIESLIKHGANRSEIDAFLAIEKKRAENLAERERIERGDDEIRKSTEEDDLKQREYKEMKELRDKSYPIRNHDDGSGGEWFNILGIPVAFHTLVDAEDYREEVRGVNKPWKDPWND